MKLHTAALLIMSCVSAAGCYSRTPLQSAQPVVNTRIVGVLTDSGTVSMGAALGPGAQEVEGIVASTDATEWKLQLTRVDHRDGRSISWNRELVGFRPGTLVNVNVVKLDKKKSWLAGIGITVGAIVAARAFNLLGAPEEDTEPIEPQQSIVPSRR